MKTKIKQNKEDPSHHCSPKQVSTHRQKSFCPFIFHITDLYVKAAALRSETTQGHQGETSDSGSYTRMSLKNVQQPKEMVVYMAVCVTKGIIPEWLTWLVIQMPFIFFLNPRPCRMPNGRMERAACWNVWRLQTWDLYSMLNSLFSLLPPLPSKKCCSHDRNKLAGGTGHTFKGSKHSG